MASGSSYCRAIVELPITTLEVVTVGYVVCALITYFCWWQKPQDAELSITVYCKNLTKANFQEQVKAFGAADRFSCFVHRRPYANVGGSFFWVSNVCVRSSPTFPYDRTLRRVPFRPSWHFLHRELVKLDPARLNQKLSDVGKRETNHLISETHR